MFNRQRKPLRAMGIVFTVMGLAFLIPVAVISLLTLFVPQTIADTDASDLLAIGVIFGFLGFIFLLIGLIYLAMTGKSGKLKKVTPTTSPANLILKNAQPANNYGYYGLYWYGAGMSYYMTFELPDKSRKVFTVDDDIYHSILENEAGILTYKEKGKLKEFVSFTIN